MLYLNAALTGAIDMKVTVITNTGTEWSVDILPEYTVEKLKQMALAHFFNPLDCVKSSEYYKLISVSQGRTLSDLSSVRAERLSEGDELLLMKKNPVPVSKVEKPGDPTDEKLYSVDKAAIDYATANIEPLNFDKKSEDVPVLVDFHTELRKILVSLVEISEKLLRNHPDVQQIFKNLPEKLKAATSDCIDPSALKQLRDMGFEENQSVHALQENNRMCPASAAEWLLSKPEKAEGSQAKPSTASATTKDSDESLPSSSRTKETTRSCHHKGVAMAMLECFQEYKRADFKPNKRAASNLVEMGFSETEVLDALRINCNGQESACEWLLGDRRPTAADLQVGLDPESSIYRAIVANPVVQLGLCTPKTLLALLQMLENPSCASRWLNDPDTAPILSQIFCIYHAEQHSMQLARPFAH
ncbi:ubiquitin-associated domain-containing protein 1-like isoform X3 [Ornithodoros turicata]|uniref:ubiquitin-associated domain-containing protein 1-like isoform X3 n=1 Tax=Ornithodoros turicata TaxID=34597 RepID=UPI0031395C94